MPYFFRRAKGERPDTPGPPDSRGRQSPQEPLCFGTRPRRLATRFFCWRRLPVGVSSLGEPGIPRATRHRRQGPRLAPIHQCRHWTSAERRRCCLLPSASEGRRCRPFLLAAEPGGAGPLRPGSKRRRIVAAIRGSSSWVLRVLVELSGGRRTSYGCNAGGCMLRRQSARRVSWCRVPRP